MDCTECPIATIARREVPDASFPFGSVSLVGVHVFNPALKQRPLCLLSLSSVSWIPNADLQLITARC